MPGHRFSPTGFPQSCPALRYRQVRCIRRYTVYAGTLHMQVHCIRRYAACAKKKGTLPVRLCRTGYSRQRSSAVYIFTCHGPMGRPTAAARPTATPLHRSAARSTHATAPHALRADDVQSRPDPHPITTPHGTAPQARTQASVRACVRTRQCACTHTPHVSMHARHGVAQMAS